MSLHQPHGCQFFDPDSDYTLAWKRLPHLAQAGTLCFITWRTADSLPAEAIARLAEHRRTLLERHQIKPDLHWKASLAQLPAAVRAQVHWALFYAWDKELDLAMGACLLRRPELSRLVLESLLHFDNERYFLTDAVVMPNHVHLIAAFRDEDMQLTQCTSWKRFTGTRINRLIWSEQTDPREIETRPKTEFWQVDQFDHLVRGPEDFTKYRKYIAMNPAKAKLKEGQYAYYSKEL